MPVATLPPPREAAAGTSPAVRRYLTRPLWWALATAVLAGLLVLGETSDARRFDRILDHGTHLTATVADDYDGGSTVTLAYDHPELGRIADAEAYRRRVDPPRAGAEVEIAVGAADPYDVVLVGDRFPAQAVPTGLALVLVPLGVTLLRWLDVRRSRRLAAGADRSFVLLGAVDRPRSRFDIDIARRLARRRPARLHLFPLDAATGDPPLCTVRLLTTAGLPVGGPPVRVEVKGSPRPFGRVVARVDGRVLLPRGRALGWSDRHVGLPSADTRPPAPWTPPHVVPWRSPVPALVVAVLVGVVATGVTLRNWGAAEDVQDHGIPVVATIAGNDGGTTLEVTYRLPGAAEQIEGRAPVDFPEDWKVGRRYPAHVDPSNPTRARLDASPYDPWLPLTFAWLPAAALLPWWLRTRR